GCTSLTSVTILDSVTSIGSYAFYYCGSLTSVIIPDTVTSIGDYAFYCCTSLTSVIIPDTVASIGNSVFSGCTSLTNVTIPDSVTSISSYTFFGCTSLTSVTIPDSVTSIGYEVFGNCTALTSVTIPDSVISIDNYAFYNCNNLCIKCHEDSYAHSFAVRRRHNIELYKFMVEGAYNNDATCTSDGTKSMYCECGCGKSKNIIVEGTKFGHSFTKYNYDNNATCTSDGTTTSYCDNGCGETKTLTVAGSMLPHSYTPQQIADNMLLYTCDCGDYYTMIIPERGHLFTRYVYNNDATCQNNGTETAICDCGHNAVDVREVEGTKLEHIFTSYIYNKDATCAADGTESASCNFGCGTVDTRVAVGTMVDTHLFDEWYTLTEPTVDSVGIEEHKCSVCSFAEQREIPIVEAFENTFTDIKDSHWFYSSVEFVVNKGYMKGMSDITFSPNSNITREQFVLILANIAGVDTDEFKTVSSGFADVPTGQWYSGAVTWAVNEGYVSGMSADTFGRGQSINRAALARMLYNYAGANGINIEGRADLSSFGDATEFDKSGNAWMVEPVQWAVDAGIISGMNVNGKLSVNPKGTATRAQAAVMLMKFDEVIE
ncbi:MAG: leucine-rich repeat protein, partial [Clostridia bacterium]|nr:leucine-rich repeat protein [Clostridia bacterium]